MNDIENNSSRTAVTSPIKNIIKVVVYLFKKKKNLIYASRNAQFENSII